jgi:hypothetical protein
MSEDTKQATQVVKKNPGHRFEIGHARFGGKKKRTAQAARDLADSLGCDPLRFMMSLIDNDTYMQTVVGPDGKKKKVEVAVTMDLRLDAAKTVVNYLYPRLTAQQVTGPDDGPLAVATLDMGRILADPALVEQAQNIALALVEADRSPASAQRILPPGDTYPKK